MTDQVDEFLEHFGVKGMHWGVTRDRGGSASGGVSAETTARREARAQKYVKRASSAQAAINTIQARGAQKGLQARFNASDIKELQQVKVQSLKDADAKRQGKLSSNQKKVLIGAAAVAAIVAGSVIYANTQNGEFSRLAAQGKSLLQTGSKIPEFKKNNAFASAHTPDLVHNLVVKGINPNYGSPGTKNNCRRATFAYELRRRGFDVAATKTFNGAGQNSVGLYNSISREKKGFASLTAESFKNTFIDKKSESTFFDALSKNVGGGAVNKIEPTLLKSTKKLIPQDIFEALSKQPDGSRGEVGVQWLLGGGHSVAYEIFNGKPVIFDSQNGKKFENGAEMLKDYGLMKTAGFTRLDNVDLNTDFLLKWVKNAK